VSRASAGGAGHAVPPPLAYTHTYTMKITDEQQHEMVRLRNDRHSVPEIAFMLGIPASDVSRALARVNGKATMSRAMVAKIEQMKALHAEGLSVTEIAAKVKASTRTVRDRLAIAGIYEVRGPSKRASAEYKSSKFGVDSDSKNPNSVIERLRADIAVLENRKGFRWFTQIDTVPRDAEKREVLIRVVEVEGDARLIIELRGSPNTNLENGVAQRSFPFSAVEVALENALSFLVPARESQAKSI